MYQEDFKAERRDREKAHDDIENYKFQLTKLQEKFTQMEEKHRHQRAKMYVLKAATVRQAEELRKVHLERIRCQQFEEGLKLSPKVQTPQRPNAFMHPKWPICEVCREPAVCY